MAAFCFTRRMNPRRDGRDSSATEFMNNAELQRPADVAVRTRITFVGWQKATTTHSIATFTNWVARWCNGYSDGLAINRP